MDLEIRAPVTAEALAWDAPEPSTSLIVKATFELSEGSLEPRATLLPIDDDLFSPSGELRYASDRVPWKASPELVVVGHAHAPAEQPSIEVRVRIGGWAKSCCARAGRATRAIPLLESHLRRDAQSYEAARMGPQWKPPAAWLQRRLDPGFDFSAFNAAPSDQWLAAIEPGAEIVLDGLSARGPVNTRIPAERPQAFLRASRTATPQAVPLRCDTFWIDADEGIACLVWRAVMPRPPASATFIIGWSDDELSPTELDAPPSTVPKPRPRAPAVTADVIQAVAKQGGELPFTSGGVAETTVPMEVTKDDRSLPSHVAAALSMTRGKDASDTITFSSEDADQADGALPFGDPSRERTASQADAAQPDAAQPDAAQPGTWEPTRETMPPPTGATEPPPPPSLDPVDDTLTGAGIAASPEEPLPFAPRELPLHVASALEGLDANADAGETLSLASARTDPQPVPSFVEESPRESPERVAPKPPLPPAKFPPAPAPRDRDSRPEAPPVAEEPRLALETIAAVRAAILDGTEHDAALAEHRIDASTWQHSERMLAVELSRESAEGGSALATQLEQAIAAAREPVPSRVDEEHDDQLERYIEARAAIDESDDPRQALERLSMSVEQWNALRREWTRRALSDPEVAADIRTRLTEKRREQRKLSIG